jgi:signal transduction histidine kinase/GAF domain-containing protein
MAVIQAEHVERRNRRTLKRRLQAALASSTTEAEIVQLLYAELHPEFGYDVVSLHILEREGRFRNIVVDHGVLQEVHSLKLTDSYFADHYHDLEPRVGYLTGGGRVSRSRGPGEGKLPQSYIWLPVLHLGNVIGAVVYQLDRRREVPPDEISLLQELQGQLGRAVSREALKARLQGALGSCMTEADIVQVLYGELHPVFGYDAVSLHVLEREGRFHNLVVDHGVLQDVSRLLLVESFFADFYQDPKPTVGYSTSHTPYERVRGPGLSRRPQTYIWVPIVHRGQAIGSVTYQLEAKRDVPADEVRLLERVHSQLGVLVSNAYLNELTRNQAVRLSALNAIARALSATHDEDEVAAALYATLSPLISLDALELIVRETSSDGHFQLLELTHGGVASRARFTRRSRRLAEARAALDSGRSVLRREPKQEAGGDYRSGAWVPILERGRVLGVLAVQTQERDAYEESTLPFLEQVADEVALALRNASSYAALEAQRRRLEVANVIGRRLASSLDRWSIVRTLREELSRHLEFDIFSVATVHETPEGVTAQAYVYDSGEERQLTPVPLATAGPAREAYEKGRPVLIRRSPWARYFEKEPRNQKDHLAVRGAVMYVTRSGNRRRIASRSIVWVPVRHGDQISALLSLQSYRAGAFSEWHVQLLEDVAAHVSLALSTAEHFSVAQNERRRLEALHVLEMGAAGAADERQVAEALFSAMGGAIDASYVALVYLDAQGQLTGYACPPGGQVRPLPAKPVEKTHYFRRLVEEGVSLTEETPLDVQQTRPILGWQVGGSRIPKQVLWVPLVQDGRVIGALTAQRHDDNAFTAREIELLESAAPVVAIMLRTVRLHRANELALTHSVRIQEVAALAGDDLPSVVASVAEQAQTMLQAVGTACWAFDGDGRVTAHEATGSAVARRVLAWSGRSGVRHWRELPHDVISGSRGTFDWNLIPLWYADRLVGALGSVRPHGGIEAAAEGPVDFARHAAITIENARLAAETTGRVRTLEAVAGFANLDIARPERAHTQMSRLVETALSGARGRLWLLEGNEMVRAPGGEGARRIPASSLGRLLRPTSGRTQVRGVRRVFAPGSSEGMGTFVTPIPVQGRVVGMLTADAGSSPAETRRLMSFLASQASLVLARLQLVGELDSQARMMTNILSHSPVGVVLEDAAGNVVYANPQIERIYDVDAGALTGTPARDLLEQAGAVVLAEAEAGESGPLELRLANRGVIVQVRRVPIPGSEEQPARVLTLHEDVTQEHLVLEAKDLMLRAIGHEVRSPAAAMRSTIAGLLQWGEVMEAERRRALVEEAYEQSDRLLSLVENQLIIAKLETRHFEPNPVPVPLGGTLEMVIGVLRNRYGKRVDSITVDLEPRLPTALCEPTHLDQVLSNLIGNALEYTPGERLKVGARALDGWLEVTVTDDGGGLPPERLQTLFQKTGPAGRNRARGGLGLGLYLCRLVVERSFGGRIWLERTGARGTVFKFTVPAPAAAASRRRPALRVAR